MMATASTTPDAAVTFEELEELVGLHEATLESLNAKLENLSSEIQKEECRSLSLADEIKSLILVKTSLKKRTDTNIHLVKELEISLERCLERLRRSLGASKENDLESVVNFMVQGDDVVDENTNKTCNSTLEKAPQTKIYSAIEDSAQISSDIEEQSKNDLVLRRDSSTGSKNVERLESIYGEIDLDSDNGRCIIWPPSNLVDEMQTEVHSLSCYFPLWRTSVLSASLFSELNSVELIRDIMDISVLESILKRKDRMKYLSSSPSNRSPESYGWVDESDIWGTCLDLHAQVDYRILFSRFRQHNLDATIGDGSTGIDPNLILCPYELGGTCADDHCPYQHLSSCSEASYVDSQTSETKGSFSSKHEATLGRGFRYYNLPTLRLPVCFSSYDFVNDCNHGIQEEVDCNPFSAMQYTEEDSDEIKPNHHGKCNGVSLALLPAQLENHQHKKDSDKGKGNLLPPKQDQQLPNQRKYFCPNCANKAFNREMLKLHLRECKPIIMAVTNKRAEKKNNQSCLVENILSQDIRYSKPEFVVLRAAEKISAATKNPELTKKIDQPSIMEPQAIIQPDGDVPADSLLDFESCGIKGTNERIELLSPKETDINVLLSESKSVSGVEISSDYVPLPSLCGSNDDDSNTWQSDDTEQNDESDFEPFLTEKLWWKYAFSSPNLCCIQSTLSVFDTIVYTFGFRRGITCVRGEKEKVKWEASFQYERPTRVDPGSGTNGSKEIEEVLLAVQIVDLCRVCVHIGRDSFALTVITGFCTSRPTCFLTKLLQHASLSISSVCAARSAYSIFRCQVVLLSISELCRARHDWLFSGDSFGPTPQWDSLLSQISHLCSRNSFAWQNLAPHFDHERNLKTIRCCLPSKKGSPAENVSDEASVEDRWKSFDKNFRLLLEKSSPIPPSDGVALNEFSFLVQCVHMGHVIEDLVRVVSNEEPTFSPCQHALNPVWRFVQRFSQALIDCSGRECKRWLNPSAVATVLIGPVIFACLATAIASPMAADQNEPEQTTPLNLDARAIAELSSLDKLISAITRQLAEISGDGEVMHVPLIVPFHALTVAISIALGSPDKAQLRIEHSLNKGSIGQQMLKEKFNSAQANKVALPSIYAFSEMLWSQIVQLRMIFPPCALPLNEEDDNKPLRKPLLPSSILESHIKLAARVIEFGVCLRNVKLQGDTFITSSSTERGKVKWEKICTHVLSTRMPQGNSTNSQVSKDKRCVAESEATSQESIEIEVHKSDFCVRNEIHIDYRFPGSLLLLGRALTMLDMSNFRLRSLASSIGFRFSNLSSLDVSHNSLSEIPASICYMASLKTLNVSCNKLDKLPSQIGQMSGLSSLDVSSNRLNSLPSTVIYCDNLKYLDLSNNQLQNIPGNLALHLCRLQSLFVEGNPIHHSASNAEKRSHFDDHLTSQKRRKM